MDLKKYDKPFIEACLNNNATLLDLDDYVEFWHTHETGNTLKEFLGMTDYEYEQWIKTPDVVFEDIIRCRREGIEFSSYQKEKIKMSQKKLYVVFDGDNVYFADKPNSTNSNRVTPNSEDFQEDSSLQDYIKAISKSHPEYSDFIRTHLDELCKDFEQAEKCASNEATSVKLAQLEADMYAGGGYGEDGANQRAEHEISRLKTALGYEGDKRKKTRHRDDLGAR